jgi:hypothetical protein
MNNGQRFCDLAYEALSSEEIDLAKLAAQGSDDALSVGCIGEAAIVFLIRKECLRQRAHLGGELPFKEGKRRVDLCFLDDSDQSLASFELKLISSNPKEGPAYWRNVRRDVSKHFDPRHAIKNACDSHERFNVLFLVLKDDEPKASVEGVVEKEIGALLRVPVFFTSDSIKLNRVGHPFAHLWNYMRVVVFTGQFAGEGAKTASAM